MIFADTSSIFKLLWIIALEGCYKITLIEYSYHEFEKF